MRFTPTLPRVLSSLLLLAAFTAPAEPVAVRFRQGTSHGFVLLRTEEGKLLGYGEYSAMPHGDHITSRLTLHFKDGSLDDETTVYTQNGTLHLVSNHHVQSGPFFSKPLDMTIEQNGTITSRIRQDDGSMKIETNHLDLPPDLSNGMIAATLLNVTPAASALKVGMVAPYGKGRLIGLGISAAEQQSFFCVTGFRCQASVFRIKPELGGVTGIVAPIIGKQPADFFVWVRGGEVPAVVREVGQLSEGGPVVSIELGGTIFSHPRSTTH